MIEIAGIYIYGSNKVAFSWTSIGWIYHVHGATPEQVAEYRHTYADVSDFIAEKVAEMATAFPYFSAKVSPPVGVKPGEVVVNLATGRYTLTFNTNRGPGWAVTKEELTETK